MTPRAARSLIGAVIGVMAAAGLVGCSAAPAAEVTGAFQPCLAPSTPSPSPSRAPSPSASRAPSPSVVAGGPEGVDLGPGMGPGPLPAVTASPDPGTGGTAMPAITLPCFAGGPAVELARIGRPAVLNLWASWCGPCRTELPLFQSLADQAGDAVAVLGVVTGDTRTAAASFAADAGVRFPAVFDPDSKVQHSGLVTIGLPTTIFLDAQGRVRHVESGPVKDLSTLEALVRRYLAVQP